jgi:uncharacterized C2H2 Zn-finger protein
LNLRHYVTVNSPYDFVDVENEAQEVETWTYIVYLNEACNAGIELEFTVQHEPSHRVEMVRATTVQYGEVIMTCPMCGGVEAEICPEFEAEKETCDPEHAFLHECGFNEDQLLDLAIEVYMDDHFEDIIDQEDFEDSFIIDKHIGNTIVLYETYSANRFIIKKNKVYHSVKDGETFDECPFCEMKELSLYTDGEKLTKCSVLSKHVTYLKKLVKNVEKKESLS